MTDIVQIKRDGVGVFVKTHTQAIENLEELIDSKISASGSGAVQSVNGKTGTVVLKATDVGALPDTTPIPSYTVATTSKDGLMSSADKVKLNSLITYTTATQSKDGLMSSADKTKLDNLKNYSNATTSVDGLMSSADKTKLNSLPNLTLEKVGTV